MLSSTVATEPLLKSSSKPVPVGWWHHLLYRDGLHSSGFLFWLLHLGPLYLPVLSYANDSTLALCSSLLFWTVCSTLADLLCRLSHSTSSALVCFLIGFVLASSPVSPSYYYSCPITLVLFPFMDLAPHTTPPPYLISHSYIQEKICYWICVSK